jgi:HAMP domain-containing protein
VSDPKALVPVEQKEVEFYGDVIIAVRTSDGSVHVPVRPVCDLLGVNWAAQYRRINRDAVLAEELRSVEITAQEGERMVARKMQCLPLDYISGFLFGINADRVKPDLKERVVRYQRECYKVLAEAFQEGRLTSEPSFDVLLSGESPAAQAYKMAAAIMQMARQQLLLETQIEAHTIELEKHGERLERIEDTLGDPKRTITPDQATEISQAVKAVAMELGKRSKRNEYGGVYGELYRRYRIPSYRELPAAKFEDAMSWLGEWLQSLTGEEPF